MARNILVPDPLYNDLEYLRFYHFDLPDREVGDLLCELCSARCQLWLLKGDRFAHRIGLFEQGRRIKWLRERVLKIETELSKRRYATREVRSQPKPKLAEGVTL